MKKIFNTLLISALFGIHAMADVVYYETNFDKMPSDITLLDRDENPSKSLSRVDFSGGSWTTTLIDKDCVAAVSSAYTTFDYSVDDWMILPSIKIESADAVLAWDANSMHYDLREDYKVMISEGEMKTSDFVEVYSVTDEEYFTRRHVVSLAEYNGKDIYIAFVHTGSGKFMLAIDNVKVGVWNNDFALLNDTDVSTYGNSEVEILGKIKNMSSATLINPVLIVEEQEYVMDAANTELSKPGEEVDFSFTLPTPAEGALEYKLAVKANEEIIWSKSDTVYCSTFPRNILVEEITGTWCADCPKGTVNVHRFEHRMRNRIIPIIGHYGDAMGDEFYQAGIASMLVNLPGIIYDRRSAYKSQSGTDDGNIYKVMRQPVTAEVVPTVTYLPDSMLVVSSFVRFAKEYDNSADGYRIGYVISENLVHSTDPLYAQKNNSYVPANREFYFLPSVVPADMMYYHDVARGTESAFNGVSNSLPNEVLLPGVDYEVVDTLRVSPTVIDMNNISVTAVVIEYRSRIALNAAQVKSADIDWSAGVADALVDACHYQVVVQDGNVVVKGIDQHAQVRLVALDGRIIAATSGQGDVALSAGDYKGVAIVSVENNHTATHKKILINN